MPKPNPPEALWKRVEIRASKDCWPWTGKVGGAGYGAFSSNNVLKGAHVWAFKLANGRWPTGGVAMHVCDNRRCCNPAHLVDGAHTDNSKDCWAKGRNFYQQHPEARPKGEQHKNAKLSNAQAKAIREEYTRFGTRQKDLAVKYGVSQRVISLITRGEAYRCG